MLQPILWGGAVAGVLDLAFAATSFVLQGRSVGLLLKVIAGGALGPSALKGGPGVAALGFCLHFVISTTAAAVYVGLSRRLPSLVRHPWMGGPLYGLLVYEVMNAVVLPLSAYRKPFGFPPLFVPDVLAHLFLVGLPIAVITTHFATARYRKIENGP